MAFINFEVRTMEGPGFVFMACDGYSEFAIHIGVEPNEEPDTVLKCIYLLTENKDFLRHSHKGFTLVFDRFEELSDRINAILKHSKGKALFNKGFHDRIASPVLQNFNQYLREKR